MNTKRTSQTISIFLSLLIAGVCLIVIPQFASQPILHSVLPLIGASLFTSGLTFFLIEMASINHIR